MCVNVATGGCMLQIGKKSHLVWLSKYLIYEDKLRRVFYDA